MDETEFFSLGALPQHLLDDATRSLASYTTALGWPGEQVGSGTFVRVNGRFGVLTASHVWDHIYESRHRHREVMLLVANGWHSYTVPIEYLTPHLAFHRDSDAWGPDLQFVELPPPTVERVGAVKSFAEISARPSKSLALAMSNEGFGAVMGFPAEIAKRTNLSDNRIMLQLRGGYISGIENYRTRGNFDYVETFDDPANASELPSSYGGVSGAGLWRVKLKKKAGQSLASATIGDDFVLTGVAFYEERQPDGRMLVRYHGPDSIYRRIPELVPPIR